MKKLMFISLLVIPFCKAADPDQSWHDAVKNKADWQNKPRLILMDKQIQAIPDGLTLPNLQVLQLNLNQIETIPDNFTANNLEVIYIDNNNIYYVDPMIIQQFPNLRRLDLSENPLKQSNIDELRLAAEQANREINIIADNLRDPADVYSGSVKPAKR